MSRIRHGADAVDRQLDVGVLKGLADALFQRERPRDWFAGQRRYGNRAAQLLDGFTGIDRAASTARWLSMTDPCGCPEIAHVVQRLASPAGGNQRITAVVDRFDQANLSARGQRQPGLGGHQKLGCELLGGDRVGPRGEAGGRGAGRRGDRRGAVRAPEPGRLRREYSSLAGGNRCQEPNPKRPLVVDRSDRADHAFGEREDLVLLAGESLHGRVVLQ